MFSVKDLEVIKNYLVFGLIDTAYTYVENRFNIEVIFDDFHELMDNIHKLSINEILNIIHKIDEDYSEIENILKPYGFDEIIEFFK